MHNVNKFEDTYASKKEAITRKISIITENKVCLIISPLIFSFLLSFNIDLYNLIPLTANANMQGMRIKFCNNIEVIKNMLPFPVPKVAISDETVYPKQNPRYPTIPKTIGIPITVEPANHITIANIKLFRRELLNSFPVSILVPFFSVSTNCCM